MDTAALSESARSGRQWRQGLRNAVLPQVLATVLLLAFPAHGMAAGLLYAFGDSGIDTGNIFAATSGAIPDPALGYWEGRFSNGPNYLDKLAGAAADWGSVPALLSGTNCAFGGAESGAGMSPDDVPNLQGQIGIFLIDRPDHQFAPRDVILISTGHNDLLSHMDSPPEVATIVQYVMESVAALAAVGGKIFVIPTTIAVQYTPSVRDSGEITPQEAGEWFQAFNTALSEALADLAAAQPSLSIVRPDLFAKIADMYASPAAYGLTNVTDASYVGLGTPATFLWFDTCHITTAASEYLAQLVIDDLEAVYGPLRPCTAPILPLLLSSE